jgi:hypothetical protein
MKKLLLVFASSLIGFGAMAQTDTTSPKHVGYFSAGLNYSPKSQNSISVEGGVWGISSNTTFGATYDFVPGNYVINKGKDTLINYWAQWVGVKAYWTTHSESKLCYMVYVAPKICINAKEGMNHELIEFGFNPYYSINKYILFGVCIGDQYIGSDSPWNIFINGGFTFLFFK